MPLHWCQSCLVIFGFLGATDDNAITPDISPVFVHLLQDSCSTQVILNHCTPNKTDFLHWTGQPILVPFIYPNIIVQFIKCLLNSGTFSQSVESFCHCADSQNGSKRKPSNYGFTNHASFVTHCGKNNKSWQVSCEMVTLLTPANMVSFKLNVFPACSIDILNSDEGCQQRKVGDWYFLR